MTETEQTPADPLHQVNRIVSLGFPTLGLMGLVGALAGVVRGDSTASVAASAVGGVTLLAMAIVNLVPVPKANPERIIVTGIVALLVLAGGGFTVWFAVQ